MSRDEFDPDELKQHVTAHQTWLRLLYMVIFLFFAWVASFVFGIVVLVLFLWHLFTGQPNAQVREFGQSLSHWGYQVLTFLSYNSEELPFPFDAWPSGPVEGAAPRKKATRKKASKKKKKTAGSSTTKTSGPSDQSDEKPL